MRGEPGRVNLRAGMLLVIDVGNTSTQLGLYDGERLAADWRITTRVERTADEVGVDVHQLFELRGLRLDVVDGIVIASVVPTLNLAYQEACARFLGRDPIMLGPGVRTGVRVSYENPKDVGADRIANALAALRRYGGPAVVIDFSTAVTYDAISREGEYLGGAIAPGVQVSLDALIAHAAKLPRVEAVPPGSVIGRTTVAAIQSGLVWGFVSQVEGMVRRMVAELGGRARVIATGTEAEMVAGLTDAIEVVDPMLTLEGLRLVYLQNS
jgi:type III pantothenate kinase